MLDPRFTTTYFSGAQARIYMNGHLITEATAIQGSIQVSKIPIFGYASHHMDALTIGRVIAMGTLTINYVFNGYLYSFMQNKKDDKLVAGETGITLPEATIAGEDQYNFLYTPDDSTILKLQEEFWGKSNAERGIDGGRISPEFINKFNLEIKDFRVGSIRHEDLNDSNSEYYESKTFVDASITEVTTIRRSDGSPTSEVYSFIAKTLI